MLTSQPLIDPDCHAVKTLIKPASHRRSCLFTRRLIGSAVLEIIPCVKPGLFQGKIIRCDIQVYKYANINIKRVSFYLSREVSQVLKKKVQGSVKERKDEHQSEKSGVIKRGAPLHCNLAACLM